MAIPGFVPPSTRLDESINSNQISVELMKNRNSSSESKLPSFKNEKPVEEKKDEKQEELERKASLHKDQMMKKLT